MLFGNLRSGGMPALLWNTARFLQNEIRKLQVCARFARTLMDLVFLA